MSATLYGFAHISYSVMQVSTIWWLWLGLPTYGELLILATIKTLHLWWKVLILIYVSLSFSSSILPYQQLLYYSVQTVVKKVVKKKKKTWQQSQTSRWIFLYQQKNEIQLPSMVSGISITLTIILSTIYRLFTSSSHPAMRNSGKYSSTVKCFGLNVYRID